MSEAYNPADISRIVEMAWEDRTPFEAIEQLYGLNQHQLIKFMRRELNAGSFRLWRARTSGRVTKHTALRSPDVKRGYCPSQYKR
ncbi:TIGR03643 family protein [Rheinheimera texasensis]|uniref:TIGR03643 family protein n=1 Tax=Rheinheimera texasensis TaxID=306205 RepID=UPI0032B1C4C5